MADEKMKNQSLTTNKTIIKWNIWGVTWGVSVPRGRCPTDDVLYATDARLRLTDADGVLKFKVDLMFLKLEKNL